MEREFIAQRLRNKLHEAEAAQQAATAKIAELLTEAQSARQQLGLALTVGSDEAAAIVRAINVAGQAEQELVSTHKGLDRLGKALKLRTTSDSVKPIYSSLIQDTSESLARSA